MPRLSVITTVHNIPNSMLEMCMVSVLNQEYTDLEYLVVCDGTNNGNIKLVSKTALADDRMKVIYTPGIGYGSAFNRALMEAQGNYIGIVDGDDYVNLDFYSRLMNTAEVTQVNVVKGNTFLRADGGLAKELNINPEIKKNLWKFTWQQWSAIYNRLFLLTNGIIMYPSTIKNNETLFLAKVGVNLSEILCEEEAFYNYCRRSDSLDSDWLSRQQIHDAFNVRVKVIKYIIQVHSSITNDHIIWIIAENISRAFIESTRIKKDDLETTNLAIYMIGVMLAQLNYLDSKMAMSVINTIKENIPSLTVSKIYDSGYLTEWLRAQEYIPPVV